MRIPKAGLIVPLVAILLSVPVAGQDVGMQDELIGRMIGSWVLEGTIAGEQTTDDVTIDRILSGHYVRIHEVARRKDSSGMPAYEAYVHIGWNPDLKQYVCQWLDITGGNGLVDGAFGYATRVGDTLPFIFMGGTETAIHNTFAYNRNTDTWTWSIDNVRGEEKRPFARLVLRRVR